MVIIDVVATAPSLLTMPTPELAQEGWYAHHQWDQLKIMFATHIIMTGLIKLMKLPVAHHVPIDFNRAGRKYACIILVCP